MLRPLVQRTSKHLTNDCVSLFSLDMNVQFRRYLLVHSHPMRPHVGIENGEVGDIVVVQRIHFCFGDNLVVAHGIMTPQVFGELAQNFVHQPSMTDFSCTRIGVVFTQLSRYQKEHSFLGYLRLLSLRSVCLDAIIDGESTLFVHDDDVEVRQGTSWGWQWGARWGGVMGGVILVFDDEEERKKRKRGSRQGRERLSFFGRQLCGREN